MSRKAKADKIIFAVGAPDNPRSSIWRLWVHGNDVYFGARVSAGHFKVSLHKDGDWRIAFTRPLNPQGKNSDRIVLRWKRPPEHIPGWTACVEVLVSPIAPKRPFKQGPVIDDPLIKWLVATPGKGLSVIIGFAKSGSEVDPAMFPDNYTLIGSLKKANGETTHAVAYEHDLTELQRAKIEEVMTNTRIIIPTDSQEAQDKLLSTSRALMVVSEPQPGATNPPIIVDVPLGGENIGPRSYYWGWAWDSQKLRV